MHSTDNLNDGYVGSGKRLWYSIKKYGKENFKLEILEILPDRSSLKKREKDLVNEDKLKDPMCLNLKIGGEGGFVDEKHKYNFIHSTGSKIFSDKVKNDIVFREKILKTLLDNTKRAHKEGKIKYITFKGKKHSEETKEKMRKPKNIGENNSQYGTMWITNGIENKKIKKESEVPQGWYKGRK